MIPLIMERSGDGAFLSRTEEGLPDSITPLTLSSGSGKWLKGNISQKTLISRILLAIS
jgi:hypothetical protein